MFSKQKIGLVSFGIFLSFILLEMGLRIGGSLFLFVQERGNSISIRQKGSYRIMCLGGSTTAGGVHSYPRELEKILNQRSQEVKFSVINKGMVGASTNTLLTELQDDLDRYNPDMVIAMMGINDGRGIASYNRDWNTHVPKVNLFIESLRIYKLGGFLFPSIYKQSDKRNSVVDELVYGEHMPIAKRHEAEGKFKESIALNSHDYETSMEPGKLPHLHDDIVEAEQMGKKATQIHPNVVEGYQRLGVLYTEQAGLGIAERLLKKAIEMGRGTASVFIELGGIYLITPGKIDEAEEMFRKAIEISPRSQTAYDALTHMYIQTQEYSKAKTLLEDALERIPDYYELYSLLGRLHKIQGEDELASEYFEEAKRLSSHMYNSMTIDNYNKLKDILTKNGVQFVAVQYPLRTLETLKRMFHSHEDIIFVDNETVFKQALKQGHYYEYFTDMFGGDFGHCTPRGNRLLAGNIANTILKGVFNQ